MNSMAMSRFDLEVPVDQGVEEENMLKMPMLMKDPTITRSLDDDGCHRLCSLSLLGMVSRHQALLPCQKKGHQGDFLSRDASPQRGCRWSSRVFLFVILVYMIVVNVGHRQC